MFSSRFRAVLWKSIGLAVVLLDRYRHPRCSGCSRGMDERRGGGLGGVSWPGPTRRRPDGAALEYSRSSRASALLPEGDFLMPAVTALVADPLRRRDRRRSRAHALSGRPVRLVAAGLVAHSSKGVKTALLALLVYLCAVPFLLVAGLGVVIFFFATAFLLGREYFLLAAMRFHSVEEAKALRKRHHGTVVLAGAASPRSSRSRSSTSRRRCSAWRS